MPNEAFLGVMIVFVFISAAAFAQMQSLEPEVIPAEKRAFERGRKIEGVLRLPAEIRTRDLSLHVRFSDTLGRKQ